jgi:hypothetical protein
MRIHTLTHAATGLALALAVSACDQGLTGLNENPNGPTDVPPEFVFPQGVTAAVGRARGTGMDLYFTSLWAQHYGEIQYPDNDAYNLRPTSIDTWWSDFYSGGLQDFTVAAAKGMELDRPNLVAPPEIMKQWTFGLMTALWGDIPYSQANLGAANVTPAYDTQEAIFDGMFTALDAAHDMIVSDDAENGRTYEEADPLYQGDMEKWQKFANSLRLRYAFWIANADATRAQAELGAALAEASGVFESNDDNAVLVWPGDGINESPLYANMVTGLRDDNRVSRTLINILQDDANDPTVGTKDPNDFQDPRLAIFAQLPEDDEGNPTLDYYVGVQNGLDAAAALAQGLQFTSKIGEVFVQADAPTYLMKYAEVEFILAEFARRGWGGMGAADMLTHYQNGIRASMELYGVPDAEITTYLAHPSVALGTGTGFSGIDTDAEKIALQHWIALYGQGIEAYTLYRLTGVPDLQAGPAAIIPTVPRRLTYPLAEQSFNNTNLQAAINAQGGDDLENDLWFTQP